MQKSDYFGYHNLSSFHLLALDWSHHRLLDLNSKTTSLCSHIFLDLHPSQGVFRLYKIPFVVFSFQIENTLIMAYIPTIAASPEKLPSFTELVGTLPFTNEPLSSMLTMGTNTPVAPQLTTPPSSAKVVPSSDCDNILSTSPLAFLRPIITKSTSNGYFLHQLHLYSKTLCASFKAKSTSSSLPSPKSMASTPSSPSEYNNNYIPVHVYLNITMTPMPGYSMPGAPPTLAPPMVFHQLQPQHQHHPLQQLPITQAAHVMHSSPHTMIHQHNTPLMTYDASLMMANINNASTESLNYIKATN